MKFIRLLLANQIAYIFRSYDENTFLSYIFKDNNFIPMQVQQIFDRVRSNADFMPKRQIEVSINLK